MRMKLSIRLLWMALAAAPACSGGGDDDDAAPVDDDDDDDDAIGPECGNGVLEGTEECDDGNGAEEDGCTADCRLTSQTARCEGIAEHPGAEPDLALVIEGLRSPVEAESPPLDVHRMFIVEQPGTVRIFKDGRLLDTPFLDISDRVTFGGERGLLNLTFHPDFAANGRFFINYVDLDNVTTIVRYAVGADPDRADPDSERVLLRIPQPQDNHNGGQMAFGPDGCLYVGMGDGGGQRDPEDRAQNDEDLLGKILRIDVEVEPSPYLAVPPDNPQAERGLPLGLIWAKGLRNPWRFDFDPANGDLYLADVGQDEWEEINYLPAGQGAGLNFGWDVFEGETCFEPEPSIDECPADMAGYVRPVRVYGHSTTEVQGCSVSGGRVYRGCAMPDWRGRYFYSDWCASFLRSFRIEDGRAVDDRGHDGPIYAEWPIEQWPAGVVGFGKDARGELYPISWSNGRLYKLIPRP